MRLNEKVISSSLVFNDLKVDFHRLIELCSSSQNRPVHFHQNCELYIVNEGYIELESEQKTIHLSPGDICLIPPLVNHITRTEGARYITVFLKLESIKKGTKKKGTNDNSKAFYCNLFNRISNIVVLKNSLLYENFVKQIIEEIYTNDHTSHYKINAYLTLLFFELSGLLFKSLGDPAKNETVKDNSKDSLSDLERAYFIERYINDYYMNKISLTEISKHLYLSKKQLERIIKKNSGMNFYDFLLKKRMAVARKLIIDCKLPLHEVAFKVGYQSYNGFYYAFKKYFGITPQKLSESSSQNLQDSKLA